MIETKLTVDGMMCSMCESHINEAVRKSFPQIKKVSSSCSKGQTVILSEQPLDQAALQAAINATGYTVQKIVSAPYEKKGVLSFFKR